MRDTPIWFMSFVWAENLVQLPFFFVATYAYLKKANWIRIPAIIYGSHVATTLVAILADIIHGQHNAPLAAIYSPYLVVPVLLTLRMALDPQPFGPAAPAASATAGGSKPKRA